MRWLDDVSMDLGKMGINEWRDRARDRDLEAYCSGGQGPPRAVAPADDDDCLLQFGAIFFGFFTVFAHNVLNYRLRKSRRAAL